MKHWSWGRRSCLLHQKPYLKHKKTTNKSIRNDILVKQTHTPIHTQTHTRCSRLQNFDKSSHFEKFVSILSLPWPFAFGRKRRCADWRMCMRQRCEMDTRTIAMNSTFLHRCFSGARHWKSCVHLCVEPRVCIGNFECALSRHAVVLFNGRFVSRARQYSVLDFNL